MGRFHGILLASDFDNTLLYTEEALRSGGEIPAMSRRNVDAIQRWMAEGGLFAVATGRAMPAFRKYAAMVPTNAPAVVDNGGAIFDYRTEEYLTTSFLHGDCRKHIAQVMEAFPGLSLEIYHETDLLQVMNPSDWNVQHALLTGMDFQVISDLGEETVPMPVSKALFVGEREKLDRVVALAEDRGWREEYELIFSSDHLLEMTARGANKGAMVRRLADMLGCKTLICAGDHMNDLSMLLAADRAFCPANAVPGVLSSGARVVCHCRDGAVGEIIEILEKEM